MMGNEMTRSINVIEISDGTPKGGYDVPKGYEKIEMEMPSGM